MSLLPLCHADTSVMKNPHKQKTKGSYEGLMIQKIWMIRKEAERLCVLFERRIQEQQSQ